MAGTFKHENSLSRIVNCSSSSVPSSFRKCHSVFLPCLLPNFKIVFIKVTDMTLNQQTHLCKMNFFFFSNSIWFLFWELILPGWVEITSINLKISLPPLPTPFPWILCQCRNHTRCQACSEGAFVFRCAGSGCIVCAVAWPWSSIIISPTARSWFCPWSHLLWCLCWLHVCQAVGLLPQSAEAILSSQLLLAIWSISGATKFSYRLFLLFHLSHPLFIALDSQLPT